MQNISQGRMVKMNVPEWFAEPEFQEWFNDRLGKGLATWQHADTPLKIKYLSASTCEALAERLADGVINADVLFEPCYVDSGEQYDAEIGRLDDARETLDHLYGCLVEAGAGKGMAASHCSELVDRLSDRVIHADVLFEPAKNADPEEGKRLAMAIDTLAILHTSLVNASPDIDDYAYADCFVGIDPGFVKDKDGKVFAEGTDSDMPEKYWDKIVEAAYQACQRGGPQLRDHVVVWLSPVE